MSNINMQDTSPNKHDHPAYAAMLAASEATGFPFRFRTDMTSHDREILRATPPAIPFCWYLYRDGTHLVVAGTTSKGGYKAHDFPEMWDGFTPEARRWFWWDGRALLELPNHYSTHERAAELLREAGEAIAAAARAAS